MAKAQGPWGYENWRCGLEGKPSLGGSEYALYTDAWIFGQIRQPDCPYQLLNSIAGPGRVHVAAPSITLRIEVHRKAELQSMEETNVERYHGGAVPDEVAALWSLLLGCRLRSGAETRLFLPGEDPRGMPHAGFGWFPPTIPSASRRVLPGLEGKFTLNDHTSLFDVS